MVAQWLHSVLIFLMMTAMSKMRTMLKIDEKHVHDYNKMIGYRLRKKKEKKN